ncbi:MAG: indolepyruvate oxidoreductase subunit beta family protein [Pseudomonadota bacterium]|nr:indolepyruvate oxidoreductase subunit beta family protein [Pseudomonadota bacterium]
MSLDLTQLDVGRSTVTDAGLIRIAILAVGGQGGGVLTDWIIALAEANGYVAQSTSVPGVAQRTGATIYYVEMMPDPGVTPVFSLTPAPGDVDIVVASEIMEAGRAVTRGFVTDDRTHVVASSHRIYAVSEKTVPGDGILASDPVVARVRKAARAFTCLDLAEIAVNRSSHISASMFGALAASGALPFERSSFEEMIRASGRGVEASLGAFGDAYDASQKPQGTDAPEPAKAEDPEASRLHVPARHVAAWTVLTARLTELPAPSCDMAARGLEKVVDFQDLAYGAEYLDLLGKIGGSDPVLSTALAKHLANAMCYDDVIKVADNKTRGRRAEGVRKHMGVKSSDLIHVTEYMHPRAEEIIGLMPVAIGCRVEASAAGTALIERLFSKGRRWRSDKLGTFVMLSALAMLRPVRRRLLRHAQELAHRDAWLDRIARLAQTNPALAVETANARRLIKGYSDTFERGQNKFATVMAGIDLVSDREDGAEWARRLTTAASADVSHDGVAGVLATIRSFVD